KPLLGEGLLTSEGDTHRRQRRLIAPAFMSKRIASFARIMSERTERAVERWADGAIVNLHDEFGRLTLGIVGKTLFDADIDVGAEHIGHALTQALEHVTRAVGSPVPLPLTWPTPQNRRTRKAIAELDTMVFRIIAEHRERSADRLDALSMLLEARDET